MEVVHFKTKGMNIADIHAHCNNISKNETVEALFDYFVQLQPVVEQVCYFNH